MEAKENVANQDNLEHRFIFITWSVLFNLYLKAIQ